MISPPKTRMTADEYYASAEYARHDLIQLIDGEMVIGQGDSEVPPSIPHQTAAGNAYDLAKAQARKHGGRAFFSPIEVYFDQNNIYEPDVLFIAPGSTAIVEQQRIVGAPDWVVEVLSPRTAKIDRGRKFHAYERFGVKEYWLVDPVNLIVEFWLLKNARFVQMGIGEPGDVLESSILHESVHVSALFEG